jgi:hypothetical protein
MNSAWSAAGCVLVLLLLHGCRAFRFEEETSPATPAPPRIVQLAGSWNGALEVEGNRIPGTLVLRQTADRLEASFAAAVLGGETTGSGEIGDDGSIRLELRYRTQCPGTVEMVGAILDQAGRLAGSLTASDCTGRAAGAFSFTRR